MGKADRIRKTCIKIYNRAKKMRPNKPERDYLELVLLTQPPYDYHRDDVIDAILEENPDIESLADFIAGPEWDEGGMDERIRWVEEREMHKRVFPELKQRNLIFFREFWGT